MSRAAECDSDAVRRLIDAIPGLVALEAVPILPILDGLDEVPEAARPLAVTQISNEHRPGGQVVVSCRTERYQAMVSRQDG